VETKVSRTLHHQYSDLRRHGPAPFDGEVLIEGDRIVQVAHHGEPAISAGAQVVSGGGATLMPGMVEAHAHLSWPSSIERFIPQFVLPPEEQLLATVRNARVLLESGFTSAYSAGALGERIEVVVRDEIDGGWTPGPRLRASTIERSPEGDPMATGDIHHGRGPEAIKAFVKFCKDIGIDQVKLQISGEDALLPGSSQHILYTEEEAQAAGEQARESDIWLSAHTQASESSRWRCGRVCGCSTTAPIADAEALDMLEAKKDEIFVAPAIGVIVATLEATPAAAHRHERHEGGGQAGDRTVQEADPGAEAARRARAARRRLRLPVQSQRDQRPRPAALRGSVRLHPDRSPGRRHQAGRRADGPRRRAGPDQAWLPGRLCCWSTAIRPRTSRSCRTAPNC
jgi:hypothetical protein